MSGELESQSLAFSKQTTLWASPANAGAQDLADEIAAAFAGLTISTTDARPANATHMLLYLNEDSFVSDERLAEQVKQAREDRLKVVMAHENDPNRGGCLFSKFFETTPQERMSHSASPSRATPPSPNPLPPTPQELIAAGLYKDLAKSCFPGRHRKALALLSHPTLRTSSFVIRAYFVVGFARASGKEPRRDSRSVTGGRTGDGAATGLTVAFTFRCMKYPTQSAHIPGGGAGYCIMSRHLYLCLLVSRSRESFAIEGADRELRKSRDATHFATDGPAPRP